MSARNRWLVRSSPVGSSHAEALRSRTSPPEPRKNRCASLCPGAAGRSVIGALTAGVRTVEMSGVAAGTFGAPAARDGVAGRVGVGHLPVLTAVQAHVFVSARVRRAAEPDLVPGPRVSVEGGGGVAGP